MAAIIPALLVKSPEEFYRQLNTVDHLVPRIHIDIADNTLVPNATWFDAEMIQDATPCDIEIHLMVDNPLREAEKWAEVPQVKRIIPHIEAKRMSSETMKALGKMKREIYLARNPGTPMTALAPYLQRVTGVLFMCITPGFQGQPFLEEVLEDMKKFHEKYPKFRIAADGHIDDTTLPKLAAVGVSTFCIGSGIFGHPDPEAQYQHFVELLDKLTNIP